MAVEVRRDGAVAVVTLCRPEAGNAIDPATSAAVGDALTTLGADPGVAVVVLTGAGDRVFCSGMDLRAFARGARPAASAGPGIEIVLRDRYEKPLVAAVNGAAVAGGLDLALSCDLIVSAEHAVFGLPEVRRGLASVGGSTRLAQRLPLAVALELGLTGEPIGARRALELGLVNRVMPAGRVLEEALTLARQVAANAPLALAATKRRMHDAAGSYDAAGWRAAQAAAAALQDTDDAREGAAAFVEKRAPRWSGR